MQLSIMRIFIGFVIAAIVMFFADQYFSSGFYTDKLLIMLAHITRSFGL
jgi:multisubunit Na+/H+ antiporter MnhE subunit